MRKNADAHGWGGAGGWKGRAALLSLFALLLAFALRLIPAPSLSTQAPSSRAIYAADGTLMRLTLADDEQYRLWTPMPKISPALVQGTLLYEDRFFRWHPGINPVALGRAAIDTYLKDARRQGGSTITMQLARRLWQIDSSNIPGKLWQILCSVWLELRYAKRAILEAYLNLAPYGGNIEGVGAASLIYFDKSAADLTLAEALTLAVIPQDPTARGTPIARAGRIPTELIAARQRLARRWERRHDVAKTDRLALAEPPDLRGTAALPFAAPHEADWLLSRDGGGPRGILSTIRPAFQELLERHVARYVAAKRPLGIHNAVAILVDARSAAVHALVGSADFFDDAISGQVNGTLARRSPGSALKPFVYALGIDQGALHPNTLLRDVPTSFTTYAPENFDGMFAGPISATEALIRSRNVPAVAVAAMVHRPSVFGFLKSAGIGDLVSEAHYGLGIALGGAEVTMQELVALYLMLARDGRLRPLRHRVDAPSGTAARLLSPEAVYLVWDMLRQAPRPEGTFVPVARRGPSVAWKTGTSWGFRDAWTVGIAGQYVLAVWVGDFASKSNPAFVGVRAAAPLFFRIVDALQATGRLVLGEHERHGPPPGLRRVTLCAVSGALPRDLCPRRKKGWFVPGKSPIDRCDIHRLVHVDRQTGRRVCTGPTSKTRSEVYEVWPSELRALFSQAGLPRRPLPPPGPDCQPELSPQAAAPRIASPRHGATYTVRSSDARPAPIPLRAETDGETTEVFWYVGRHLVGRSQGHATIFWQPRPGEFLVRAVDRHGRSDSRRLRVELLR